MILHLSLVLFIVIVIEYTFQFRQYMIKNRPDNQLEAKPDCPEVSMEEFKSLAALGKSQIVLLENNVIDLKEWEVFHPGGKFFLQKNIGRDITKYWYGGYQMINKTKRYKNMPENMRKPKNIGKRKYMKILK